ncbi:hypothetical protein V6N13_079860 [Hibiscus sabdariffa]
MDFHSRQRASSSESSGREFGAQAHEVPSGPNPISNSWLASKLESGNKRVRSLAGSLWAKELGHVFQSQMVFDKRPVRILEMILPRIKIGVALSLA